MTFEIVFTLGTIAVLFILLVRHAAAAELLALGAVCLLLVTGILSMRDVLGVFSNPAAMTVATMFIVSAALKNTGVIDSFAMLAVRLGKRNIPFAIIGIFAAVLITSFFVNNTSVVIIMIPVMITLASRLDIAASKLLLPLSYMAILGGTCTLIGTSTNLLVDGMAQSMGLAPFGMFEIFIPGLAFALAGSLYMATYGRKNLPSLPAPSASTVQEIPPQRKDRAVIAILALLGVIIFASFEIMPIAACCFIAAVTVILTGCIRAEDAYRSLQGNVLLLIYGMLALSVAMVKTGGLQYIVDGLVSVVAELPPVVVLSIFYFLTSALTEMFSNNATAVLLTPVAIGLAESMGVDPRPFAAAVMFGASASFATPLGYQTNTLVFHAGGYRFNDFLKIGTPMNLLMWLVATIVIPLYWDL